MTLSINSYTYAKYGKTLYRTLSIYTYTKRGKTWCANSVFNLLRRMSTAKDPAWLKSNQKLVYKVQMKWFRSWSRKNEIYFHVIYTRFYFSEISIIYFNRETGLWLQFKLWNGKASESRTLSYFWGGFPDANPIFQTVFSQWTLEIISQSRTCTLKAGIQIRAHFLFISIPNPLLNEREEFMQETQHTQQTATRKAQNQDKKTAWM